MNILNASGRTSTIALWVTLAASVGVSFLALKLLYNLQPELVRPVPEFTPAQEFHPVRIRFGALSVVNPSRMYESFQPVIDYLQRESGYTIELELQPSYRDLIHSVCDGRLDFAYVGPLSFHKIHTRCGAIPLVKTRSRDGGYHFVSQVVVRQDSPIQSLADLAGRSFAFADPSSTSGNFIPRLLLASVGIHLKDLGHYDNFPHHDSVLQAVIKGEYDAGAVKDVVAKRYLDKGLRVIASSFPIPNYPIICRKETPEPVRQKIGAILLALDPKDPATAQEAVRWFEDFRYGFYPAAEADYIAIGNAYDDIPKTCGDGCHKVDDYDAPSSR